jgi:O-methyltransferase domain/Dimerisation domain
MTPPPASTATATRVPAGLAALGLGFCGAKLLLSALELGVFTVLAGGALDERALVRELGLHGRGARDFLEALVALGLLERRGLAYANTADVAGLVRGPGYAAGFLDGANHVLYPAWNGLTAALRSGLPQADGDLDGMLRDPGRRRLYLAMMDGLSAPLAPELARAIDWGTVATVADIGGARGNMVALLLGAHPHLRGIVFDRPQNAQPCAEHTAAAGVGERVEFRGGDFFTEPLPEADVLVIGHVLADFAPDERRALIRAAYRALPPGGTLLVYDPMPADAGPSLESLVASLHMLVMTPAGAGYRPAECGAWMTEAGFARTATARLPLGNGLVLGHKGR